MQLPFFYQPIINTSALQMVLTAETSKHCVQVLRMKNGEKLQLTNGLGSLVTAEIIEANKTNTIVKVIEVVNEIAPTKKVSIAISLLKNNSRFEWFLEKATEIGIAEIFPLMCQRTERQSFKFERLNSILISAMLQSRQVFLPVLHQPVSYHHLFANQSITVVPNKLIAHCLPESKTTIHQFANSNAIILIGPEGDFSQAEIEQALQHEYVPVTLGQTRLRTETAGIVAATLLINAGL